MCIGFVKLATSPDERYKLIILNNRDEDFDRPTAPIHWHDGILSGVDNVVNGTWLGMNSEGKIGMLFAIVQSGDAQLKKAPYRGEIVNKFLKSENGAFYEELKENASCYKGFQFVGIDRNPDSGLFDVHSMTNRLVDNIEVNYWKENYLVYSNSPPHVPFKKTGFGLQLFSECLQDSDQMTVDEIFEKLLEVGTCPVSCFPDDRLGGITGYSETFYKPLTSIFVRYPETRRYGTRSHTLIVVDRDDKVTVLERRMEVAERVEESVWLDERVQFEMCRA